MANRDEKGKFAKGHSMGKRFQKGVTPWNKGKTYKCKQYNLSEEGRLQKLKNLGKYYNTDGKGFINENGYRMITVEGNQMREHRYIWLKKSDWHFIPQGFVIHHVNGDKLDNRIENLMCLPNSLHTEIHRQFLRGEI